MEKKIIAVISVVVLLASVLAACAKKPTIKLKEGQEYLLATDKEGNTLVNDDGYLVIYVTDEDGKYVKDSNGERQTAAVTFPNLLVEGTVLQTPDFKMTFPEGWVINNVGKARKNGNENMFVKIDNLGKLKDGETPDDRMNSINEGAENAVAGIKTKYPNTTLTTRNEKLTMKEIESIVYEVKALKDDGTVVFYSCEMYFMFNGEFYKVHYRCMDGGYDETLDIISMIDSNLVMKDKKAAPQEEK